MTRIDASATVGQIVARSPRLSRVFEELDIDYCCGGKRPLDEVCREKQLDLHQLVERLSQSADSSGEVEEKDWNTASLADLCDHIEQTYHAPLRDELPRLSAIIDKVVRAHGQRHPDVVEVQAAFAELRAELEPHMMKEECILFPAIRYLERHGRLVRLPFGSLSNPIRVMCTEHDHAGDALSRLRSLTRGYIPPWGACNTYHAMLEGLESLERDMHQHVHKENNILFPRAVALEESLASAEPAITERSCSCSFVPLPA
jgi:regulator of cell morphogenesis and NO signaling